MKIIGYSALVLLLSGSGVLLWWYQISSRQQTALEQQLFNHERILLEHYREEIDAAKAENKKEIVLPPAIGIPTGITSLEQIMRGESLLRVKVKDEEITVGEESPGDIDTWYKLEVLEVLLQQDEISAEPLVEGAPARLLPLLPSESPLVVSGGAVTADGIKVVRLFSSEAAPLYLDQEYLIAARLDYGGKIILPVGSAGIFLIENSTLRPTTRKHSQIAREIEQRYGNDLTRLRSGIQSQ